jgi:transcriptional regulator with XRE-family HTH domain
MNNLKQILEKQGMTQTDLAIKAGLTASAVSMIVRGQRCQKVTARKIAKALTVKPLSAFPDYDQLTGE